MLGREEVGSWGKHEVTLKQWRDMDQTTFYSKKQKPGL